MDIDNLKFITSSKLFTTVFDEEMSKNGFKRKGHLFYRLQGEFLQGIVLKTVNPWWICYCTFPVWSLPGKRYAFGPYLDTKGYWAESGMELFPRYLYGGYYRKENVKLNFEVMEFCLDITRKFFLPILDNITDIDSYIEYKSKIWEDTPFYNPPYSFNPFNKEFYEPKFAIKYPDIVYKPSYNIMYDRPNAIDSHAYLYKAYLENNFDNAYNLLKKNAERIFVMESSVKDEMFDFYEEKMMSNDLDWIANYREERLKFLAPAMKKDFRIDLSL